MRLLHIADLHLDRAFGGMAFAGCDGARRRELLRRALEWAVDTAIERQADAVTIGGDLFELEHVTSDTAAFIARQLGRLDRPVLVVPGNHDYASAASPYRTIAWPAGVTLALEPRPVGLPIGDVTLWAVGYNGREIDQHVLDGFRVPADGRTHLLVVHGVDLDALGSDLAWGGLGLRAEEVRAMGFTHALLGHVHAGRVGEVVSWPGSPVPLDPGEVNGNHGLLWVEAEAGAVTVESIPCGMAAFGTVTVDVSGVADSSQLGERVQAAVATLPDPARTLVTVRVFGRRTPGLVLDAAQLAAGAFASAMGVLVIDATAPELDLSQLAAEPNARGKAISRLLDDGSETAMKAARLIVESFEGEIKVPV